MPPSTMDLDKRFYSGPSSGDLIFPNSHSIPPNQITSLHDEAIVQFVVYCELPQKIKINTSAVDVAMDLLLTRPTGENQSITNLKLRIFDNHRQACSQGEHSGPSPPNFSYARQILFCPEKNVLSI